MSSEPRGDVFISYAREDRGRVEPLVWFLDGNGVTLWWDRQIALGTPFRSVIEERICHVAGVVVAWTAASAGSDFVRWEAQQGYQRGVLVPVLLEAGVRVPPPFAELQSADLAGWDGQAATEELRRVLARLRALAGRGAGGGDFLGTLREGEWAVQGAQDAASELRDLTRRIGLDEVLAAGSAPARDLTGALAEVGKTYRAVAAAVRRFVAPALARPIDPQPFLDMEGGSLLTDVERGRGHCSRIAMLYGRYGGLRDWLEGKLPQERFQELDQVFASLSTADGDLFAQLAQIGGVLTNESRVIANLLLAGQEEAARQRILQGRQRLAPLEEQLTGAMLELQRIQAALGYAEPI